MDENCKEGRDTFSILNLTISVTCKPKIIYSSSATNWSNDMSAGHIRFPDKHEVKGGRDNLPRDIMTPLFFIRDSAKQFLMSSLPEDFQLCIQGGHHLDCECNRVGTMTKRLENVMIGVTPLPNSASELMSQTLFQAKKLQTWLEAKATGSNTDKCRKMYKQCINAVEGMENALRHIVPKYHLKDIQASDAGPGDGTSEMVTRL
jgi:hypothetical protein